MKPLFAILSVVVLWSCDPFNTEIEKQDETVIAYEANRTLSPREFSSDTLKVASWNIKFGGGRIDFFFDCYGDRSLMTEEEVTDNLEGIAAAIRQIDPDIIFLQEADVESKRSAYVNQVQWILDHTDLDYAVYASQWKADYVPSDGIGRMNSGNAILSKYPLNNAERTALPLIDQQSGLVQYFYLRRNLLSANIENSAGEKIVLLATHTSAYARDDTKEKQLQLIKDKTDALNSANTPFVLGGDFNSLPPRTVKLKDFPDDVCPKDSDFSGADFTEEADIMERFYVYQPLIPIEDYADDNSKFFTFTADKNGFWNRKLDFMFTNQMFQNGVVHLDKDRGGIETMQLSDHAPLSGLFILK